jgi:5'-3' exoribonuclease 1
LLLSQLPACHVNLSGVPKFFRTVSERYAQINVNLDSAVAPEFDNLYIDLNGVVHNCARGSSNPGEPDSDRYLTVSTGPRSNTDIFIAVFKYLDNLFALVQPRALVYLAIDGVAPRAKMNQQRGRRFRSAKERKDEHDERFASDPMYKAANVTPFDSNCITPGTVFMAELTNALDYFVHKRVSEDAAWAGVEVVLSGAEVPGEGEHKIMEYIRAMKLAGKIAPDTRHVVYGLDADLIMLGLVTHEAHFALLREKVDFTAFFKKKGGARSLTKLDTVEFGDFQLLSVSLMREYLALDVGAGGVANLPYFDIERIVDDFIFAAMLVGNDFLPNLPYIEMADGALSTILFLYKRLLPRFGGYIIESGRIVPERFELFVSLLGLLEEDSPQPSRSSGGGRGGGKRRTVRSEADFDMTWGFEVSSGIVPVAWTQKELAEEQARVRAKLNANIKAAAAKRKYYRDKLGFDTDTEDGAVKLRALATSYVEGVCWTLKYYFEGCASWRWFYPSHYAPMASDLHEVAVMLSSIRFTRGIPFKPMEQLLSVLPPSSAWCLPKPYQLLMTHATSPIRDKYPVEFETDQNGKRNDWEAVVLLPFITEADLLSAMASVPSTGLTADERVRSAHGISRIFSRDTTPGAKPTPIRSVFPGRLPDLQSYAITLPLELPVAAHGVPFQPTWTPGSHGAGTHPSVADMPTFNPVPHAAQLAAVGVNVFGQASRNDSLLITLGSSFKEDNEFASFGEAHSLADEDEGSEEDDTDVASGQKLPAHWASVNAATEAGLGVGAKVWVGYPWRLAGIVVRIIDATQTVVEVELADGSMSTKATSTNVSLFSIETSHVAASLMDHRAVDVGRPRVLFGVRVAIEKDPLTGVPTKFASKPTTFAAASVVEMAREDMDGISAAIGDGRNLSSKSAEAERMAVRPGDFVMSAGDGPLFGCTGRVQNIRNDGQIEVIYSVRKEFALEPAFANRVVLKAQAAEKWMTVGRASDILNLPRPVVGSLTGSIRVKVPESRRDEIDVGLGIKYSGRGMFVPGYAKIDERGSFVLSNKAVNLIAAYRSNFPDLFTSLSKHSGGSNGGGQQGGARVYEASELFGSGRNAKNALTAAAAWVATSEVALLPLVTQNAKVLPKSTIADLEKEALIARDLQAEGLANGRGDKQAAKTIAPRSLIVNGRESAEAYESMVMTGGAQPVVRDDGGSLQLGARVVNRLGTGPVPFGLRGTVVGIHPPNRVGAACNGPRRDGDDCGGALVDATDVATGTMVAVAFDEGFIGGGDLGGLCRPTRGKAVAPNALFVLSPATNNVYYTTNFARVASAYTSKHAIDLAAAKLDARERELKSLAIARAALRSYADAAKGNFATKPSSIARLVGPAGPVDPIGADNGFFVRSPATAAQSGWTPPIFREGRDAPAGSGPGPVRAALTSTFVAQPPIVRGGRGASTGVGAGLPRAKVPTTMAAASVSDAHRSAGLEARPSPAKLPMPNFIEKGPGKVFAPKIQPVTCSAPPPASKVQACGKVLKASSTAQAVSSPIVVPAGGNTQAVEYHLKKMLNLSISPPRSTQSPASAGSSAPPVWSVTGHPPAPSASMAEGGDQPVRTRRKRKPRAKKAPVRGVDGSASAPAVVVSAESDAAMLQLWQQLQTDRK